MTQEQAIDYCETHECKECVIYINNLDTRTKDEWMSGILCCSNLLRYELVKGHIKLPQ